MANSQPNFNIGRDATLQVIDTGNIVLQIGLTEFESKQTVIKLKARPLNSSPVMVNIPDGHSGSFSFDRYDGSLDAYFAQAEDNYWAGADGVSIIILQTINDPNGGAPTQFRFEGVVLEGESFGTYKADAKVEQKVGFEASRRRQVS